MITDLLNVNLVEELGLDKLNNEDKDRMINQMSEVIESRINLAVLDRLSDADKSELDKVLNTESDLITFLREKISNFDVMVAEIVAEFKKEMVELNSASPRT